MNELSDALDDLPVDVKDVVWRAHRRLGRRAVATLLAGAALSALLGLGGDQVRDVLHDTTTTTPGPDPTVPLGVPVLAAGSTSPRTVELSWTEPAGEPTGYVVRRNGDILQTVGERRFVDTGLVPRRTYAYTVAARNALGEQSPESAVVRVTMPPIDPPTNLEAKAEPGVIALSWAPSADDGVVAYLVSRDGKEVGRVEDGSVHRDTKVVELREYRYEVRAVDAQGHRSEPATVAASAADATPPSPPTNVSVVAAQQTTTVRWSPSQDNVAVAGYDVLRGGEVVETVDGDTTTFREDEAYYEVPYTVVAFDAAGNRSKPSEPEEQEVVD